MALQTLSANSTAINYRPGGTLTGGVITTQVGNVNAGEDDLMTFSLPASLLAVDQDRIEVQAAFTFAGNANNKQVKFFFGSNNAYATGALALNGASLVVRATVIRVSAAVQKILVSAGGNDVLVTTAKLAAFADATETLSSIVVVKFTGEGTATDDVVQELMTVSFYPFI